MTAIDATGIHAIETFARRLRDSDRALILCGAMEQPSKLLQGTRFIDSLGGENIVANIQAALDRAKEINAGSVTALRADSEPKQAKSCGRSHLPATEVLLINAATRS